MQQQVVEDVHVKYRVLRGIIAKDGYGDSGDW